MTVTYQIQVLQIDRPGWLADLRQAVAVELQAIGMHRSVAIDVTETITGTAPVPTVAVALVGPSSATDAALAASVGVVLAAGTVTIPVVDDLNRIHKPSPDGSLATQRIRVVGDRARAPACSGVVGRTRHRGQGPPSVPQQPALRRARSR